MSMSDIVSQTNRYRHTITLRRPVRNGRKCKQTKARPSGPDWPSSHKLTSNLCMLCIACGTTHRHLRCQSIYSYPQAVYQILC
jgi:hypothetical protein